MLPTEPERPKADKIHQLALTAEKALEGLATELAHAGADETATAAVGKMAEVMRKILTSMAKGGTGGVPDAAEPAPAPQPSIHSATGDLQSELAARRAPTQ